MRGCTRICGGRGALALRCISQPVTCFVVIFRATSVSVTPRGRTGVSFCLAYDVTSARLAVLPG